MQTITKLFSVYDSKAAAYKTVFAADTTGVAVRMFETACRQEGTEFAQHPADFTLFEIGSFSLTSGQLYPLEHPLDLGTAASFLKDS